MRSRVKKEEKLKIGREQPQSPEHSEVAKAIARKNATAGGAYHGIGNDHNPSTKAMVGTGVPGGYIYL